MRQRSLANWVFYLLFMGFNAVMLFVALSYCTRFGDRIADSGGAGTTAAGTMAMLIILFIWACGALITGLLERLTR